MARTETLRYAFEDFIGDKEYQGASPAMLHFYRSNWEHFRRDTGVATLDDLTLRTIRAWLLKHKHLSPHTLATYERCLRVITNWFEKRGYLSASPMRQLPKRRTPPRIPNPGGWRNRSESDGDINQNQMAT
ncbi:MAG: hypothetical protein U5K81_10350 [Trueperaceae bacterium]|nr:hypothetical protein [Trueperaceae bacterium]